MEIKKNPKYDLEKKRKLFFQFGLVVSLLLVIAAFEWTSIKERDHGFDDFVASDEIQIEMDIPPTKQESKPPQPPPPPNLEIVDDKTQLEYEPVFENTEIGESGAVEEIEIDVTEEEKSAEQEIFLVVEQMPQFPGGFQALAKYLSSNIKYPVNANENNIQGMVYVRFEVTDDGKVDKAQVMKGIGGGCDEEALRVVNSMPRWEAGKQKGKAVNCWYTLPINFTLID